MTARLTGQQPVTRHKYRIGAGFAFNRLLFSTVARKGNVRIVPAVFFNAAATSVGNVRFL